jgi:hypothetical protein
MVVIREILMRYDVAKTEEDREKSLNQLKGHCGWNHNHTKPSNLKRIRKANAEEVKGGAAEDTSEEEDPDIAHYKTTFKAEEEFSKDVLSKNMVSNNSASSIHPVSIFTMMCVALLPESGLL